MPRPTELWPAADGRGGPPALLVVCATVAERDAAGRHLASVPDDGAWGLRRAETVAGLVDLVVGGVGVAAAAATTAIALTRRPYDLVLSVGIAGGFAPVAIGATVVATAVVEADLGAEDGETFLPLSVLGFGDERHDLDARLAAELAGRTGAITGAVLCVSTVTGSASTAASRLRRSPDAAAEAMEGAGVLAAAHRSGVPFAEIRTISNRVGPRERDRWQIGTALDALGAALGAITAAPLTAVGPGPTVVPERTRSEGPASERTGPQRSGSERSGPERTGPERIGSVGAAAGQPALARVVTDQKEAP